MSSSKSQDFKPQEKRESKIGKTVGMHVDWGGGGRGGDGWKERKKEIADNKNPEQIAG
jgi:hypothetical protein